MARQADRLPPMSIDAEQAALGAILAKPETLAEVIRQVPLDCSRWFYRPDHRLLYEHLIAFLGEPGVAMDLVTLSAHLARAGVLAEIGGDEYLMDLCESYADAANAKHYAGIVREKGILRDVIAATERIRDEAFSPLSSSAEVLDDLDRAVNQFHGDRKRSDPESFGAIGARIKATIGKVEAGVKTGFPRLDRAFGGLKRGSVYVIAARPSVGKTGLGCAVAMNSAGNGHPVLVESLEMTRDQVWLRMVCSRAKLDTRVVEDGTLGDSERFRFETAVAELSDLPLAVNDVSGMTIQELRADIRASVSQFGTELVVVDYLGLIRVGGVSGKRAENRNVEVTEISAAIKGMARESNVPIVLLAQLNRQSAGDGIVPELHHLRDSGSIEQDADAVVMLWRDADGVVDMDAIAAARKAAAETGVPVCNRTIVHGAIRKNRNGPLCRFDLTVSYESSEYMEHAAEGDGGDGRPYTSR